MAQASAGTIRGTVHAEGKKGADEDSGGGKYDSAKLKFVERINYAELRDFVIYIEGRVGTNNAAPAKPMVVDTHRVTQQGAVFSPHILAVMVGTTVEWPNNDSIFHNVFSISDAKEFDLGLYKNPEVKQVLFDKPGRVDVFCSIHANMNCAILVLQNRYFTVADNAGRFVITNVPPGTYKLKAWHERLPGQSQEITVPEEGEVKVNFTLGITNLPKY